MNYLKPLPSNDAPFPFPFVLIIHNFWKGLIHYKDLDITMNAAHRLVV